MDYSRIIFEPGKVTRIIMNRPKFNNALSHPMFVELEDAFNRVARDPEIRVVVVSGAGNSFSAGHDAIGVGNSPEAAPVLDDGLPPEELIKRYGSERDVWREYWIQHNWYIQDMQDVKMVPCPKPTIAMVHGYAIYGGLGMATNMDVIFATEDALFLSPGMNEQSCINWRRTIEMAYEHRFFTGREAHELGMVNRVFPDFDTLERETLAYAERVASQTLSHLMEMKQRLLEHRGLAGTFNGRPGLRGANFGGGEEGERFHQRYEGRGMARTPRALDALRAKLISEGKPVPANLQGALDRAAARDPKASWERDLQASWRDPKNREQAKRDREAWEARVAREKEAEEAKSKS